MVTKQDDDTVIKPLIKRIDVYAAIRGKTKKLK
jgi:hypothetical protein